MMSTKTSIICKAFSKTYINGLMHVRYAFGYIFSNSLVSSALKIYLAVNMKSMGPSHYHKIKLMLIYNIHIYVECYSMK